jgi:hypothetical protein
MVKARERCGVMCVLYLCTYCVRSIVLGPVGILMYESWNIENDEEGVWEREPGY